MNHYEPHAQTFGGQGISGPSATDNFGTYKLGTGERMYPTW